MLKNMEIIVGDSETVKLVNGSRGVVTKMVSAKQMLPELKERSKKWDEEYKKKRQELERERLTDKEMDKELKPLQSRYQKLTMQIEWIKAQKGDVPDSRSRKQWNKTHQTVANISRGVQFRDCGSGCQRARADPADARMGNHHPQGPGHVP